MNYGICIGCDSPATHAVVFKEGRFCSANDRGGEDRMTVAIGDIVFCEPCAQAFAGDQNDLPVAGGPRCDHCDGPANSVITGNANGIRCAGHVQQFLRGRTSEFYTVRPLVLGHPAAERRS